MKRRNFLRNTGLLPLTLLNFSDANTKDNKKLPQNIHLLETRTFGAGFLRETTDDTFCFLYSSANSVFFEKIMNSTTWHFNKELNIYIHNNKKKVALNIDEYQFKKLLKIPEKIKSLLRVRDFEVTILDKHSEYIFFTFEDADLIKKELNSDRLLLI